MLTYYHEGTHICNLKPNVAERRKALERMPLPLTGTSKPLQYQKDSIQFHMDNGNIEEAFDVVKAVSHADVVHEIKKLRKYPNHSIHRNDELDAFGHVQ